MIDLHYWPTPNGHKIMLFLEEAGLDFSACSIGSLPAVRSLLL
jgi:glutathione S-transferase